jgi:hypothetical protein
MDDWTPVSEFEDRWAPVEESMDPWHVVQQAPVDATPNPEDVAADEQGSPMRDAQPPAPRPPGNGPQTPAVVSPDGMDFSAFQSFLNQHAEDPNNLTWRDYLRGVLNFPAHVAEGTVKAAAAPGTALQSQVPIISEQMIAPATDIAMMTLRPSRGVGGVAASEPVAGKVGKAAVEEALAPDTGRLYVPRAEGSMPSEWKPVNEEPVSESIRSAAILHEGKIYEGALHSDAYQTAADATGKHFREVIGKTKPEDAGFMSTHGRYMTRDEAAKLIGYEGKSELAAEQFPEGYYEPAPGQPPTEPPIEPPTPPPEAPKPPQALADDLQALRQSSVADRAEVGNTIRALPEEAKNLTIGEKLYHAAEDPAELAKLTPGERALYDQHLQPLRDEQAALAKEAVELGGSDLVDDPNYIHRIAKGHAPQYDSLSGDSFDPVTGTKSLPRTTSALQERKYFAIESPEGVRKVVTKSPDGVTVWNGLERARPEDVIDTPRYDKTNIPTPGDLEPGTTLRIGDKNWKVTQARTAEIEKYTPTEYHKNAFVNTADAVVRLREVVRNLEFVEDVKSSDWWSEHAVSAGGNQEIPKGWVRPKMPQFSDWYVDPKYAAVLDDFYKPGIIDPAGPLRGLRAANQFAASSMFWNPIPHMQNVGVHWAVGRGWDWIRPSVMRHFAADMTRAVKSVVTQNRDYQGYLREGGGLVYGGVKNADFYGDMGRHMGMEIEKNWGSWKPLFDKLGLKTPYEATAWWYGKMRNVLWATSDMFMMHRYLELERKGMSPQRALKEAEKHIPNYRIPTEIAGSRAASMIAQEPALTLFSRYHYGMWKSFVNMATDLAKGSPAEKKEALGNVAALAFMGYVIYPVIDAIYQKVTGDDKAKMLRRGAMSAPHGIAETVDNNQSFSQFLSSNITAAPATKEVLQQFFGKDFFTGNELDGAVPRAEHAAGTMLSPYGAANQMEGGPTETTDKYGQTKKLPEARSTGRTVLDTVVGGENTSPKTLAGKAYGKMKRNVAAASHERNPKGLIERGYYGAKHAIFGEPPKEEKPPRKKKKDVR